MNKRIEKEINEAVDDAYQKNLAHPLFSLFQCVMLGYVIIQMGMVKELTCFLVFGCIVQGVVKALLRRKIKKRFKGPLDLLDQLDDIIKHPVGEELPRG